MIGLKKPVVVLLAVLLLIGIAACGDTQKNLESTATSQKDTVDSAENGTADTSGSKEAAISSSNHFTLYCPIKTVPINLNGEITKEIMNRAGIVWDKVEIGNGGDITQQINLKLASGNLSDAITLGSGDLNWSRLISEKKLIPLDKYFDNPEEYPVLAAIDKNVIDFWRAADGHIYFIPTGYEPIVTEPSAWQMNCQGLYIRDDLLKQAGMTYDSIRTITGFEEYLKKVKGVVDSEGRKIIPMSLGDQNFAGTDIIEAMFGVKGGPNGGWNELSDGTVVQDYQTDGFKKAWQWLNKMYREGLLDPETPYQKRDLFLQKNNGLQFAAIFCSGWDNPDAIIMQNYGLDAATTTYAGLKEKGFPAEWYFPAYLPKDPDVKLAQLASFNPFGGTGTGITTSCKNPDALVKGLDWMHTEEAWILMEYGPESMGAYTLKDGVVEMNNDVFQGPKFWGVSNYWNNVTELGFYWWKDVGAIALTHIPTLEPPWNPNSAMLYRAEEINQEQGAFGLISKANRIQPIVGGAVEKYGPIQTDIRLKYYAKMMVAKTDGDFNAAYNEFINEMKVRGHDSETIAEFNKQYSEYSETPAGKISITVTKFMPRNVYGDKPAVIGR